MRNRSQVSGLSRLALLLTALVLVVAACSSSDDEASTETTQAASGTETTQAASGTEAPTDAEVDLDVFWFKVNLVEKWQTVTDEYTRQNPNVTIATETVGGDQAWLPLLKSKFAAGEGPDIYMVEGAAQADAFAGFMADLSGEPWVARAIPSAIEGLTIDGVVRGMPLNLEGYGYIYNKGIFEEAGVTERPRTLSELRAAAEKIEAAGYIPFSTGYGIWWVSGNHLSNMPFAHQDDPTAFLESALARETKFADDPLFAALKDLTDLTLEYGEDDPLTSNRDSQQLLFLEGKAAMFQQGNWREIEVIEGAPDMEYGLLPMPLDDDPEAGDRLPVGVPFYLIVNEDSTDAEKTAAKSFLNWLVSSDYGKTALVDSFGFIPAYPDIDAGQLGGISDDIIEYSAAGKIVPWIFGQMPDGAPNEMSEAFQRYVAGGQDWETTLAEWDSTWDRLTE
jgi:raffinose/stachyose/melibiose transport system substrate-binding protein